jgi:hypothetical protein
LGGKRGGHYTPLVYVCKPKALFANEGYHLVVCIIICVKRMARSVNKHRGKYAGEESVTAPDAGVVNPWQFLP